MIETPSHDLLPLLEKDKNIEIVILDPLGNQYVLRINWLHPPFDNAKIRQRRRYALDQPDFLEAMSATSATTRRATAFRLRHAARDHERHGGHAEGNFEKAKELPKEAGYDGTPIVLMQPTDLGVLTNLAPVAKAQLERAGFKVDMQSMDWQTLVTGAPRRCRSTGRLERHPRPPPRPCC